MSRARAWTLVSIILAIALANACAATRVRTLEEFDEVVLLSEDNALVNFHRPGCPHCAALAPHWSALEADFHARGTGVTIVDVDCEESREVCARFGVRAVHTVRFFTAENGEFGDEYGRGRELTYDALATFCEHRLERVT